MALRRYSFVVYGKEPSKQFTGILGAIDLHVFHFLLVGGKQIITEEFDGTANEASVWYQTSLREQDIHVREVGITGTTIWLQVDLTRTHVQEFLQSHELSPNDEETLAWRIIWHPCTAGTTQECLGFTVKEQETTISGIPLDQILQKLFLISQG